MVSGKSQRRAYEEVFETCLPEDDEEVNRLCRDTKAPWLALIAPYAPLKVSPTRAIRAELGPPEEFGVETFILRATQLGLSERLYLLLHSFGGGVDAAYVIAKALRAKFKEIVTFVPQVAASGATLIAICSNSVVLGDISRLSPIDIQVYSKGEWKPALALIRALEKLHKQLETTAEADITYPYRHLVESIDVTTFEAWSGMLAESETYARTLLQMGGYDLQIAAKVAEQLVFGYASHNTVIDLEEARRLELRVEHWSQKYGDYWRIARRWLGKYLLSEAPFHHIRYVLPMEVKDAPQEDENSVREGVASHQG